MEVRWKLRLRRVVKVARGEIKRFGRDGWVGKVPRVERRGWKRRQGQGI